MQIHNAIITGSFSYNGADLSNVTSSNAYSASLSSRTTDLESTSSVLVGASSSFSSVLSSVSSSQQQISSSFLTLTASFNAVSASQQQISASYIALSASYNTFSGSASTRITENSSSIQQVSSSQQQISASYIALSGSYNVFSGSASTRVTQIETVYATTGSNSFRATQSITGSLTVTGQIIAQTLNVQQVTSSIIYSSGSNNFGCDLNSRQTFTGSVLITGSLTIAGASSATSYSGTTIYGSTAVCSQTLLTNTISLGGNAVCPTNAGLGYGMFGYSGIGLGIASSANGPNQGMGFFVCGDVERMRIITSGNVGIGTVCPSYLLDVNGTGRFACSVTATTLALGSVTPCTNGIYLNVATANGANYGYIRTNCLTVNTTQLILGSTYGYNTPVDALTLFNGSATFASSVTVYGVLNVGGASGTYSVIQRPTAPAGSQGIILTAGAGKSEGGSGITFSDNSSSGGTIWLSGNSSDIYGGGVNLIAYGQTAAANIISFATRSGNGTTTERAQITSGGNLIVGNPAYAGTTTDLSITGDKVNSDGYYSRLIFQNSNQSGASSASIRGERKTSNYNTELTFYTADTQGAGAERMRITSAGNLNFNTAGSGAAYININQATSQDGGLIFLRNNVNRWQQAIDGSNNMVFYSYQIGNNAYKINLDGSATLYGALTQNASDRRLKNNITNIPNALSKIQSLNGVTFNWENNIFKTERTSDIGVIAQEVKEILPEAVTLAPFDNDGEGNSKSGENYLTVYYEKLIPLLIEGIKELSAKVTALEKK